MEKDDQNLNVLLPPIGPPCRNIKPSSSFRGRFAWTLEMSVITKMDGVATVQSILTFHTYGWLKQSE